MRKEDKPAEIIILDFKNTTKIQKSKHHITGMETNRAIKKNKIENLEIHLHVYSQLSFEKNSKNMHWVKGSLCNSGAGRAEYTYYMNKTRLLSLSTRKIQLKVNQEPTCKMKN